jgi:predicted DNA-binding transcriptional regulator AlpA
MTLRATALSATRPAPRRALSRVEAAQYVGVGSTKFDELVATGRMPRPKRIDSRKVWDIQELDMAFDSLPDDTTADDTWSDVNAA